MKFAIIVLLPVLFAVSGAFIFGREHDKRLVFDTFLNGDEGRRLVDQLVEKIGTAENEAKCEQECHILIRNQESVMQHLCPFLCHMTIEALNHLHSPGSAA